MRRFSRSLLILGFTAVFVGYLSVWLRGPGVGLTFLGVEMGEWFKFLGLGSRRDLFYLPPIILGLMLVIWTWTWPATEGFDWRGWTARGLGIFVSLLAFPAIEDIRGPVRGQYLLRVVLIGVVILVALITGFWRPKGKWRRLPWLLLALLGLIGALFPTRLYLQVQPFLSDILGVPVSAGLGFWLNLLGNILIVVISLYQILTIDVGENKKIGVAY
ncbi:MAG: hypothetical protein ACK2T4_08845 [Candidatus Promineifilaceae bacterium]|jgi:hypothetical protein